MTAKPVLLHASVNIGLSWISIDSGTKNRYTYFAEVQGVAILFDVASLTLP